jgi:hypothetical protein
VVWRGDESGALRCLPDPPVRALETFDLSRVKSRVQNVGE